MQSTVPRKAVFQSRARLCPGAPAVAALGRQGHARSQAARRHTQAFIAWHVQHKFGSQRQACWSSPLLETAWAEGCRRGGRAVEVAGLPLSGSIASLWAASPASSGVLVQGARDALLKFGTQRQKESARHSLEHCWHTSSLNAHLKAVVKALTPEK